MSKQEEFNIPSRLQWIIVGVAVVIMLISIFMGSRSKNSVETDLSILQDEMTSLSNDLAVKRQEEQKVRNEVIYRTTGIHPETVRKDTTIFKEFISPAFTWSSGEEYDEMRAEYISLLGENSPFIDVYIVENLKVDDFNYIDINNLKSTISNVDIYPLVERDGVMDYMGVVEYYLYNEDADLVGHNAHTTTTSKAMVKFTMNGEGDARTVTNMTADAGFASTGTSME